MDILTILAIFLVLYGLACLYVGLAKPKAIWGLSKLQGFVQLLGEKGTVIMLVILGLATLAGGIFLFTL
ncbi:MAG TPA: hypothetical protein PKM21_11145 [Anaerolineales bacterium]|nr:hypothetical protein [Anaerolineales bacterium]